MSLQSPSEFTLQPLRQGQLRAAGYDRARRVLRIEFTDGRLMDYQSVGDEIARRFLGSANAVSFFRDNIEEEYTGHAAGRVKGGSAPANPFD
jgi:hypothetical protein